MPKADDSLIAAIIQKMDERNAIASKNSLTQWSAVKKLMALKDIVIGVGFFCSLIGGAFNNRGAEFLGRHQPVSCAAV